MCKMHTRFSKVARLSGLLAKLFASKAHIATNCVRLFRQSSGLVMDFAAANVYYISSLRISDGLEACL